MASWLGSCPMTGMRALQALATPTPLHAISQRPHFTPARSSNRLQRHCSAFAAAVIAPQHGLCTAWRPVRVASARAAAPPAAVQQSAITRQRRPVWAAATAAEAEPPQQQQQPPQPMSAADDVQDLKQQLRDAIAGTDRGIFGLPVRHPPCCLTSPHPSAVLMCQLAHHSMTHDEPADMLHQ